MIHQTHKYDLDSSAYSLQDCLNETYRKNVYGTYFMLDNRPFTEIHNIRLIVNHQPIGSFIKNSTIIQAIRKDVLK